MIINSGIYKNSKIIIPKQIKDVRPTSSKLREAVFSILSPFIRGSIFYDIFCGSGIMGFQALSCGAGFAVFIDKNRILANNINRYIRKFNIAEKTRVINGDAMKFLKRSDALSAGFSVSYVDPPYCFDRWGEFFSYIDRDDSLFNIIIMETSKRLQDYVDNLKYFDNYKYKRYSEKQLYIIRKRENE